MIGPRRQYLIKLNHHDALVAYCSLDGRIVQASESLFQQTFGLCVKTNPVIGYPIQSLLFPDANLHQVVTTCDTSKRSSLVRSQQTNALLWFSIEAVSLSPELEFCLSAVSDNLQQEIPIEMADAFLLYETDMDYDSDEDDIDEEEDVNTLCLTIRTLRTNSHKMS